MKLSVALTMLGGILILFYMTGIIDVNEGATSRTLAALKNPTGIRDETATYADASEQTPSNFSATWVLLISGLSIAGSIFIGWVTKSPEWAIIIIYVPFISLILWDFSIVYVSLRNHNPVLALLIFAPVMFMLIPSLIDYMTGRQ